MGILKTVIPALILRWDKLFDAIARLIYEI